MPSRYARVERLLSLALDDTTIDLSVEVALKQARARARALADDTGTVEERAVWKQEAMWMLVQGSALATTNGTSGLIRDARDQLREADIARRQTTVNGGGHA